VALKLLLEMTVQRGAASPAALALFALAAAHLLQCSCSAGAPPPAPPRLLGARQQCCHTPECTSDALAQAAKSLVPAAAPPGAPPCSFAGALDKAGAWAGGGKKRTKCSGLTGAEGLRRCAPGAKLATPLWWRPERCTLEPVGKDGLSNCTRTLGGLHVSFVGDSMIRGLVCSLSRLLGPHEGVPPGDPQPGVCGHQATMTKPRSKSNPGESTELIELETGDPGLRLWWRYAYGLDFRLNETLDAVAEAVRTLEGSGGGEARKVLVLSAAPWDFNTFARRKDLTAQQRLDAEAGVNARRREGVLDVIGATSSFGGVKVYLNAHCNVRFDARKADTGVVGALERAGWLVLDAYGVSRHVEPRALMYDGLHFDRTTGLAKLANKKGGPPENLGAMENVLVQVMLQLFCV